MAIKSYITKKVKTESDKILNLVVQDLGVLDSTVNSVLYKEVTVDLDAILAWDTTPTEVLPLLSSYNQYYRRYRIVIELTKPSGINLLGPDYILINHQGAYQMASIGLWKTSIGMAQVVIEVDSSNVNLAMDGLSTLLSHQYTGNKIEILADAPFSNGDANVSCLIKCWYEIGVMGTEL